MNVTSLEHKTVRPGSLTGYSYYRSNRRPLPAAKVTRKAPRQVRLHPFFRWLMLAAVVCAVLIFGPILKGANSASDNSALGPASSSTSSSSKTAPDNKPQAAASPAASTVANHCAGNSLSKSIIVSIGQRHLWACQGSDMVYNTPVVTGIDYLAADRTPPGTYHIYDKVTDTTLKGSDSTGSWSDPVHYWMPFLHNQYGSYGFHDATWRDNSAFGNISPGSADASHGCVELPLSAAAWLYNWAAVGTTATIQG